MGALMALKSKIDNGMIFARRPIEGAPALSAANPARATTARRLDSQIVAIDT